MRSRSPRAVLTNLFLFLACPAFATESLSTRVEVGLGFHYSRGHYGTSQVTEIDYVPLTARLDVNQWSAKLTLPYLHISGNNSVVEGPNGPLALSGGSADGLGDLLVAGTYTFFPFAYWAPFIEFGPLLKIPTADPDKGLGTGAPDVTTEAVAARTYDRLTPFAGLGYRYVGNAPTTRLHDGFLASGGALYRLVDHVDAGCFVSWRQTATPTTGDVLDVVPFATVRITPHWLVDSYVTAGLASGSPDVGTGVQVRYRYDSDP